MSLLSHCHPVYYSRISKFINKYQNDNAQGLVFTNPSSSLYGAQYTSALVGTYFGNGHAREQQLFPPEKLLKAVTTQLHLMGMEDVIPPDSQGLLQMMNQTAPFTSAIEGIKSPTLYLPVAVGIPLFSPLGMKQAHLSPYSRKILDSSPFKKVCVPIASQDEAREKFRCGTDQRPNEEFGYLCYLGLIIYYVRLLYSYPLPMDDNELNSLDSLVTQLRCIVTAAQTSLAGNTTPQDLKSLRHQITFIGHLRPLVLRLSAMNEWMCLSSSLLNLMAEMISEGIRIKNEIRKLEASIDSLRKNIRILEIQNQRTGADALKTVYQREKDPNRFLGAEQGRSWDVPEIRYPRRCHDPDDHPALRVRSLSF